ncbi:MAG TPA: flagellar biosynthesis protein FlhA [Candidatus Paceibacterota bacterium]|nr:flagellar biosynthesis protein FlhA [Candidatus Paceibacterota bacterium]
MAKPLMIKSSRWEQFTYTAVPLSVVAIVVVLIIPLPTFVIDMLITANITGSVLVLLTAMQVKKPLEFSVFPTLVLLATMFRLALNVAVTRQVLLNGYAGIVVSSFGHFVIGGSIVVGLVVFFILIIIQFVVITSGSGRVAEVAARFTLDAMPGKQMAIDADRASGAIDEHEAHRRRREIADEADFYGAMDGASKFVRGDAIAAIVITMINLVGGFAIGVFQRHLSPAEAISTYSLLSVGDGLVSQIPALLLSLATGIIVTRGATEHGLGYDVVKQLSRFRRIVRATGLIMAILAIIPGLPALPFLLVGGLVFTFGSRLPKDVAEGVPEGQSTPATTPPAIEESPDALAAGMAVEPLSLELGIDLIDLVQSERGGDLLDRVKVLRRNVAMELGVVMPRVHTRDNLDLPNAEYAIKVHGIEVARGQAPRGKLLAIGENLEGLAGTDTRDPAFGGRAKWIPVGLSHQAAVAGVTVVDRSAVVTTHLAEIVREHAGELVSRQDTKLLLDALKATNPVVLEEMAAVNLTLGDVQGVLRGLLDEGVPVRDLVRIIEALTEQARSQQKDADSLLEAARLALATTIGSLYNKEGELSVITFSPALEQSLLGSLRIGERGRRSLGIPAGEAEAIVRDVGGLFSEAEATAHIPVLLCATRLRPAVWRLFKPSLPRMGVVGVGEIGSGVVISLVGSVNREVTTVA